MCTDGGDDRDFFGTMAGDGRPLLLLVSLGLLLSGLFALFLGVTGQFLPHDERFLGMTAQHLCSVHGCRIVHFMIHDRIAFGGALVAIGLFYLWLVAFPLSEGRAWAWWLLLVSSGVGFASFLAYLGYGYLDTWHGVATLALLPCFVGGLVRSRPMLVNPRGIGSMLTTSVPLSWTTAEGVGRICLLATAIGMTAGGLTILTLGVTWVFVPQDFTFLGLGVEEMHTLNPRLVLCLAGLVGFGAAIGVHFAIGYIDLVHLAPAVLGATLYLAGLVLNPGRARHGG
jgi:hypothetical protein